MLRICLVVLASALGACSAGPAFEYRAASLTETPGSTPAQAPGSSLRVFVQPEVVIDDRDVASAALAKTAGGERAFEIHLTDSGARKLGDYTAAHLDQPIAIIVDGKLCSAPIVLSPLTKTAMVMGGPGGLSEAEADRLVRSLNRLPPDPGGRYRRAA